MHHDYGLLGGILALGLISGGLLRPAKTKEQKLLERLDQAERAAIARANSPEVAAAEAKRERKRLKRLAHVQ